MDELISQIVSEYAGQGIFIALFIWLLFITIRNNKDREDKYQATIGTLTDIVKTELVEIKGRLK